MGDLLGAMVGYIGGKDGRTTGNMSLPVYKGMLAAKSKPEKPKLSSEEEKKKKDYLMKMYGGGGDGDEKKKKKKRKVRKDASSAVTIIDHDEGLGGVALATAKGAKNLSDEEMSDEQAVIVEEEEIRQREEEEENKISSVQVGDGGSSGSNWVQVDEDGNVIEKKPTGGTTKDLSPPRRSKRSRHDSDSDQSPPRKRPGVKEEPRGEDQSPPRRRRHDSDDDQSPPRRKAQDLSPPRRKAGGGGRHDSDSDQSPPRKRAAPAGGGARHDSDSDQSPPRRKGGADQSPPRRRGGGGGRHDSDSDQSPPRSRAVKEEPKDPNARTVNGLRAGFVSGSELSDTMRKKKEAEDARFKKLEDKDTGRVAATVYRDKKG